MSTKTQIQAVLRLYVALGLLLWPAAAAALRPSLDISQYAHTTWNIRDGSLKGAVRAIVQTADGYLWLGTEFGLVRFDGVQFLPWNPPHGQDLPSGSIRSLLAARDGTLWIGTLEGLASWKDGKLTRYTDIAGQNVLSLLEDREGTVWAGTFGVPKGKLCAIQRGKVECFGDDGSIGQWVWSLYEDADGRLWVGSEKGLWRWKPDPRKRYEMSHAIETPQSLAQGDNPGELLAVARGIQRLKGEKIGEYPFAAPPGRLTPVSMFRDRDGGLWVGTLQHGILHVWQGKATVFGENDGLSGSHVMSLFEDKEGNVWIGTTDGLDRFRETTAFSLSVKQGLSSPSVWSVLVAHDNSAWITTLEGLNRWMNGHVTIYRAASESAGTQEHQADSYVAQSERRVTEITDPGLPENVGSLCEDDRGRIWVSSPKGIARFEKNKFRRVSELPGGWVNVMLGDNAGGVWISYQDRGLMHWVEGRVVETVPWSRLGGNVTASAVIRDPVRGGLWLGFFQGGLVHFKNGQVRASYGAREGLGAGRVMGIELDRDGVLWAATEGGLSRLKDGRVSTLTTANGLPCNTVHWSMELEDSFWLYTTCGLLQVARSELNKWAADPSSNIPFTVFDSSDGVRSHALLTGYTPRVSKSADGKLWFAHFQTVSVVDPRHLALNKIAPAVHIEQIIAHGKTHEPSAGLRLPPLVRDLEIDYTALSLVAPEKIQFRVKLEGQDDDWRVPVNPRHSHYTNLAPRHYRFRVIASNNSGVWNERGDTVEFTVAPAYYQTKWFRALCVVVVIALLCAIYFLRLRQLHHEFEMTLDARVDERTRIARELHDTLLQSFHGLLLHFQAVSQLLPERAAEAKEKLDRAIDQAAGAITEGRDAVQGLRTSTIQSNDLALAISALGEELATESAAFRVAAEGQSRNLHPIVRDEIYKIAAEALRNAFRHARPRQVEVEIRYDHEQLRLRVRDDGIGIDPAVLSHQGSQGHYGLPGMRERARLIGATLTVWSQVDAGTEVELCISGAAAYRSSPRRRRSLTGKDDPSVGYRS